MITMVSSAFRLLQAKFTHHSVVLQKEIESVLNGNQKLYGCKRPLGREAPLSPFYKMRILFFYIYIYKAKDEKIE